MSTISHEYDPLNPILDCMKNISHERTLSYVRLILTYIYNVDLFWHAHTPKICTVRTRIPTTLITITYIMYAVFAYILTYIIYVFYYSVRSVMNYFPYY